MYFLCLQFFQKTNLKILIFALAYLGRNFSFVFWKNWRNKKVLLKLSDLYSGSVVNKHSSRWQLTKEKAQLPIYVRRTPVAVVRLSQVRFDEIAHCACHWVAVDANQEMTLFDTTIEQISLFVFLETVTLN